MTFSRINPTPQSHSSVGNYHHDDLTHGQQQLLCIWASSRMDSFYGEQRSEAERRIRNCIRKSEEVLDLSELGLSSLPYCMGNFRCLQKLLLGSNQLKVFPEGICDLTQLQELDIGGNWLWVIPKEISNLQQLKKLCLSHNQLTSLPDSIGKLRHLQEMDLRENELISIPESIGDMENLQLLNIAHNKLKELPQAICSLSQLRELNLEKNELESLPEDIGRLAFLRELNLASNKLINMPKSVLELTGECQIQLQYNPISRQTIDELSAAVKAAGKGPRFIDPVVELSYLEHEFGDFSFESSSD